MSEVVRPAYNRFGKTKQLLGALSLPGLLALTVACGAAPSPDTDSSTKSIESTSTTQATTSSSEVMTIYDLPFFLDSKLHTIGTLAAGENFEVECVTSLDVDETGPLEPLTFMLIETTEGSRGYVQQIAPIEPDAPECAYPFEQIVAS